MSEIQRLSHTNLEAIKEQLKENSGYIENSDLRKRYKIKTKPQIYDLTTRRAPSPKRG